MRRALRHPPAPPPLGSPRSASAPPTQPPTRAPVQRVAASQAPRLLSPIFRLGEGTQYRVDPFGGRSSDDAFAERSSADDPAAGPPGSGTEDGRPPGMRVWRIEAQGRRCSSSSTRRSPPPPTTFFPFLFCRSWSEPHLALGIRGDLRARELPSRWRPRKGMFVCVRDPDPRYGHAGGKLVRGSPSPGAGGTSGAALSSGFRGLPEVREALAVGRVGVGRAGGTRAGGSARGRIGGGRGDTPFGARETGSPEEGDRPSGFFSRVTDALPQGEELFLVPVLSPMGEVAMKPPSGARPNHAGGSRSRSSGVRGGCARAAV
jgi:hypothetical protein